MPLYPDLTRDRHATVKKSHKAVIGALLIAERPLIPVEYHGKVWYTVEFMMPSGPVWDASSHPLILSQQKAQELIDAGFVVEDSDYLHLTRGGAIIAEGCRYDWEAYWDLHYASRYKTRSARRFDWKQYFKTGVIKV